MKTIKVSEVLGTALDWLVAKCEGCPVEDIEQAVRGGWAEFDEFDNLVWTNHEYSTDWAQGGPIKEREGIGSFCNRTAAVGARFTPDAGADWRAFPFNRHNEHHYGPTELIAAMRCYVTSKLGETAEVPEELA